MPKLKSQSNGRITLALIGQKVDELSKVVQRIDTTLNGEVDEPGMKGRLKILEDHESSEKWYFRSIWGAIVGSAVVQYFTK